MIRARAEHPAWRTLSAQAVVSQPVFRPGYFGYDRKVLMTLAFDMSGDLGFEEACLDYTAWGRRQRT